LRLDVRASVTASSNAASKSAVPPPRRSRLSANAASQPMASVFPGARLNAQRGAELVPATRGSRATPTSPRRKWAPPCGDPTQEATSLANHLIALRDNCSEPPPNPEHGDFAASGCLVAGISTEVEIPPSRVRNADRRPPVSARGRPAAARDRAVSSSAVRDLPFMTGPDLSLDVPACH
jgi:hypothetical protein